MELKADELRDLLEKRTKVSRTGQGSFMFGFRVSSTDNDRLKKICKTILYSIINSTQGKYCSVALI